MTNLEQVLWGAILVLMTYSLATLSHVVLFPHCMGDCHWTEVHDMIVDIIP